MEDVGLARRRIHIVSGRDGHRMKTGKSRVVPITTERLLSAFKEHIVTYKLDIGGSPSVFHHRTTRRDHERGARISNLLHSFQNAAARAKLPDGVRPYDLRHTAVTRWSSAGHPSFRTTERYIHLSDEALDALIERPKPNERIG